MEQQKITIAKKRNANENEKKDNDGINRAAFQLDTARFSYTNDILYRVYS